MQVSGAEAHPGAVSLTCGVQYVASPTLRQSPGPHFVTALPPPACETRDRPGATGTTRWRPPRSPIASPGLL